MSLKDQTPLRIVFYEGEGAQPLDAPGHFAAVTALLEKGYAVTRVSGEGSVAPVDRASLLVLGRFDGGKPPHAADAGGEVTVTFQDITGFDTQRITETIETNRINVNAAKQGDWKP